MSSALDSFLDKWRDRWPEWTFVERFVAEGDRARVVAWFALLQEFDNILNATGDTTPQDAKLAWWGEELRSWAAQRSRHPLGRVLEPVRAPWDQLADALPSLIDAREQPADVVQARNALGTYASAVANVEAAVFDETQASRAADAVLTQMLAQRVQDLGAAAVPRVPGDETQWEKQLLAAWPSRVDGPRPRRLYASLARARLQARMKGGEYQPRPVALLWRSWWAARG
ncbi:squalene/phytoene synthase family protein [Stenotrophomonas sp. Iso1]|uniref:squalene/phytoene synthase family protein n=1 Tax=Stenotrophomonas sp. Iso1 TaxID=2977283 RepID=UPI0022B78598|nr:squalene/phytoene synthase family protein [Stenotrophomonas sp. Iso1]